MLLVVLTWIVAIGTGAGDLIKKLNGSWQVTEAYAHVNHAVVEDLIGLLSKLAWTLRHLLEQVKSDIHIWVRGSSSTLAKPLGELSCTGLDTLDQSAAGKIVGLKAIAAHELEVLPGLGHLVAPDKNIYE